MYDDMQVGYDITAIALGMDALERRLQQGGKALDTEGLIPIYTGEDLVEPNRYADWTEAQRDLAAITAKIGECPLDTRKSFLEALVRSLRAAIKVFRGEPTSFAYRLEHLVGVPAGPADEKVIEELREEIDRALARRNIIRGSLAERVQSWQGSKFIPVEKLESEYRMLQEEAVRRTAQRVFDVGDFRMELVLTSGTHAAGRCNFLGKTMEINTDIGCTRAALKHLVTHENFPGHATQLLYTADAYRKGNASADVLLCTLNGIPGVIQEGIGDQATEIIDWVEDDDDVIQIALRRLRIAVATTASWKLMQLGEDEQSVVRYIKETGFAINPYVDGRITQAKHIYRGPFNASYYHGNQAVREVRLHTPKERFGDFITYLYGRMHSLEGFLGAPWM